MNSYEHPLIVPSNPYCFRWECELCASSAPTASCLMEIIMSHGWRTCRFMEFTIWKHPTFPNTTNNVTCDRALIRFAVATGHGGSVQRRLAEREHLLQSGRRCQGHSGFSQGAWNKMELQNHGVMGLVFLTVFCLNVCIHIWPYGCICICMYIDRDRCFVVMWCLPIKIVLLGWRCRANHHVFVFQGNCPRVNPCGGVGFFGLGNSPVPNQYK